MEGCTASRGHGLNETAFPALKRRLPQHQRREQLLGCALAVTARKGLGRTVHTEIAALAGVATPTVFAYFPTRKDLLEAVIGEVDRFYIALGKTYHDGVIPPCAAVRGHLEAFSASIDRHPDHAQVWLEWAALVRNEEGLWDAFLDFQERIIKMVTLTIRRGQRDGSIAAEISAADAARLVTAAAYAVTQLKFMRRSPRMIQGYVDQVLDLTLKLSA